MYTSDKQSNETTSQLEDLQKRKAAYALNLCMVSLSQIIDYNDKYILEQEYDAILNNLNLQNFIKEESLLVVIRKILDVINGCRIKEGEKEFIEREYQQKMKNAIWASVPNLTVIFSGGNPVQIAVAAATQVGIGYMNYRKNKNEYALSKEKQVWELQVWAMEQFHGLRFALFEAAWRFADKFDYDDVLRLTEKQIGNYNEILIDHDPLRRFERLNSISDYFLAFPPFWYYMGSTAREICLSENYTEAIRNKFKNEALTAFKKFNELHVEFMREDVIAASSALEQISLLSPNTDYDEMNDLLKRAVAFARSNHDILQMCVPVYMSLQQIDEAKKILKKLVNEAYNLEMNGYLLSRIYYKQDAIDDYQILIERIGAEYVAPWTDDDSIPRLAGSTESTGETAAQTELEKMISRANKIVIGAAVAAGGVGAVPIPFADAPLLVANQVALLTSVAVTFKINIKKDGLKTLVYAALGVGGATLIGRTIVSNLIKFIPGVGSVIGGAISASTAAIITYALGYAFIEICKDVKAGKIKEEELTSKAGISTFKEYFKSFAKKKAKEDNEGK